MKRHDPAGPPSPVIIGRPAEVEVLSAALAYALGVVGRVRPDDHDRPSPCAEWTVGDVLRHLLDSFDCLSAALNFGRVDLDEPAGDHGMECVVTGLTTSARSLERAARRRPATPIAVGELPLDRESVIMVAAVEAAVHGWDLGAGTGRPTPIPDPLAGELLQQLPAITGAGIGVFAPPLSRPEAATPGHRLLAELGRDWRFLRG